VALRPRLSPGVPLSRESSYEIGIGTGDVNMRAVRGELCVVPY
jgi:hypothetical protein